MIFRYTPEGAEPREWPYDPNKLMNVEAEEIERRTGMTFGEWGAAVEKTSMRALHGLLFVMLKRDMPTLKWDEVVFSRAEVEIELELADKKRAVVEIRAGLASGAIAEDDGRPAVDELESEIAEAEAGEPAEADEDPKGPVSGSAPSGGRTLHTISTSTPATSTA